MRSIEISTSDMTLRAPGAGVIPVEPAELACLYWRALEAPGDRIARALHLTPEALHALEDGLCEKLGRETLTHVPDLILDGVPMDRSAVAWPERHARTLVDKGLSQPDDTQLVFLPGEGTLSVADMRHLVAHLCAALSASGVKTGDVVAVDAVQRFESYLIAVAALSLGVTVVRLGETVGAATLSKMASAVPATLTFSDQLNVLANVAEAGRKIALSDHPSFQSFSEWLHDVAPPEDGRLPDASVSPTDVAFIGFTSGSTGEPKPIRTSHEALYRSTEAAQHLFAFGPDDIFCTSTAFSALSAFRSLVTLPFLSGGRVMIPSAEARHHPLALALECQTFGVTRLTAVPNVLRGLVKAEARLPHGCLSSLKTAFSGSGVLDQPTARMFRSTFGVDVVDYYGGREFATACYSEPDADDTMSAGGGMVSNALACLVDHAHIPVPVGGIGEIVVHSDCLTLSELPSISDEGPWAGWHFTGDLGRRMEDGRLEIVGRRKDIVKTQDGELVNPAEVEGFLNEMPEILEACVFGWSGDDAVERLAAAVLLSNTIDQGFEDRARAHILEIAGSYKVPSHVFAMDTLPRVAQNKPDKIALKEHFLKTILKQAF